MTPAIPTCRKEPETSLDIHPLSESMKAARAAAELLGWIVLDTGQGWRRPSGQPTQTPIGAPTWLVMGHGIVVFLEWDDGRGGPSREQQAFQDSCRVAGVPHRVVRTVEEAVGFLAEVAPLPIASTQGVTP